MKSYLPALVALLVHSTFSIVLAAPPSEGEPPQFETDIRPILRAYCLDCHGGEEELSGGLDLRLKRFMLTGGDSGPAIEVGDAEASLLIERIRSGEMPPAEVKLPPQDADQLAAWINAGAPTLRPEPESIPPGIGITPEERDYWFYQPLARPEIPAFAAEDRVRTPIDALLLKRMREVGLSFSPDADKLTLIRRAAFDLTGLPPTQAEIDEFLADESPEAYERLLDRLLASPHYGERWGRHWLDTAGYADSEGYTADTVRPHAYRYRDYVIRAFNADKPFNEFLIEQLAGDELVPPPYTNLSPDAIEKLVATGFLRMAADGTAMGGDQDLMRNQVIGDTLQIVSSTLLGLTVGCAQCHDHRYDPIPQENYFALRAIFEPALNWKQWRNPQQRLISLYTDADRAQAAAIEEEIKTIAAEKAEKQAVFMKEALEKELEKYPEELRGSLRTAYETPANERNDEQKELLAKNPSVNISPGVLYQYNQAAANELKKFDEKINELRGKKPPEEFIRALSEVPGQIPKTHLFHRGDHRQLKDPVPPADLTIAAPEGERFVISENNAELPTTGRRLAFAQHLTSGTHPLLGRVLMNRIWLHHFGRGIVDTPGDFGRLGTEPTHPELLDFLATEFVERGWSLKAMHKLIMTSTVYRQSSQIDPAKQAIDDANVHYWRMPIRRLEAEAVRDRILATTGALDRTLYGPPVAVEEDTTGQVIVPEGAPRRSVYLQSRRSKPVSFLVAFDAPVMAINCDRRISSTVAPQALMLMNSDFILKQAEQFAKRLAAETPADYPVPESFVLPDAHSSWQFGYGAYDSSQERVASFQPLPHWTGSAWQGGDKLPNPEIGWAILNAGGGHPGDPQFSVIRRWIAPAAGVVSVAGKLKHSAASGDGVRGRILSSRTGLAGEWIAANGETATPATEIRVEAGDTLDFFVDCRENTNADSFQWIVDVSLTGAEGESLGTWNSSSGFHGPPGPPLAPQVAYAWQLAFQRAITIEELQLVADFLQQQFDHLQQNNHAAPEQAAMTNLCQQLLSANEFLYID